jgi:hypothetical protein
MVNPDQRLADSLYLASLHERTRFKNSRLDARSWQRELVNERRRSDCLSWHLSIRAPLVASNWIFMRVFSLWPAIPYSPGVQPETSNLFNRFINFARNQLLGTCRHVILQCITAEINICPSPKFYLFNTSGTMVRTGTLFMGGSNDV